MTKEIKTVLIFGLIFAVLAAGAFFFVNEKKTKVEEKEAEIVILVQEVKTLREKAALEEGLQDELDSLKVNFAQYVKILPSPEVATEEKLLSMLAEKCDRAQFGLGNYLARKPRKAKSAKRGRKKAGGFREIDVTLSAKGTFDQFLRFLNSLERHESFLRVNTFTCNAPPQPTVDSHGKETWPLDISLNISTFRYDSGS